MRGRKRKVEVLSERRTAAVKQRNPRKEVAMSEEQDTTEDDTYMLFET